MRTIRVTVAGVPHDVPVETRARYERFDTIDGPGVPGDDAGPLVCFEGVEVFVELAPDVWTWARVEQWSERADRFEAQIDVLAAMLRDRSATS